MVFWLALATRCGWGLRLRPLNRVHFAALFQIGRIALCRVNSLCRIIGSLEAMPEPVRLSLPTLTKTSVCALSGNSGQDVDNLGDESVAVARPTF